MKVRMNDINGDPLEIYCEDTDELGAAIDVLQEKGQLARPPLEEIRGTDSMNQPAAQAEASAERVSLGIPGGDEPDDFAELR